MSQENHRFGRRALAACLLALATTPAALADGGVFLEQNGLVAIQFEANPSAGWTVSTSTPGWTGQSYYRWDGANYFPAAVTGFIGFDIEITTPGTYTLYIRNRHEHPNPTEENDVWVRMDNHPFEKVFSNMFNSWPYVPEWTWESRIEHTAQQQTYFLSAGLHRIEFAARSYGFKMDRVHLALPNQPDRNNVNAPLSVRRVGTGYGTAVPNSTGQVGQLEGRGSSFLAFNNLTLRASSVPANRFGVFLAARSQGFTANPGGSLGNLLLGANFGRFGAVVSTGAAGVAQLQINNQNMPQTNGRIPAVVGETWYFQFMHREAGSSNFTRGLSVQFE